MFSKILLIFFVMFLFFQNNINITKGYNNSYCESFSVDGKYYPALLDGGAILASKKIGNGIIYIEYKCENGIIKKNILNRYCNYGYILKGDYCIKKSYINYYFDYSCESGFIEGFYHPEIKNGKFYTSSKTISNGKEYITFYCNKGNENIAKREIKCNYGYIERNGFCVKKYSNKCFCNSGEKEGFYYPNIKNGKTYHSYKKIKNGKIEAIIYCKGGNSRIIRKDIECDKGYIKKGDICIGKNLLSCKSGRIDGFYYPVIKSGDFYETTKKVYKGRKSITIYCKGGNIFVINEKIECNSGYIENKGRCVKDYNCYLSY